MLNRPEKDEMTNSKRSNRTTEAARPVPQPTQERRDSNRARR